jgi:hypothetical protein
MTLIGYTVMCAQAGPKQLVTPVATATILAPPSRAAQTSLRKGSRHGQDGGSRVSQDQDHVPEVDGAHSH